MALSGAPIAALACLLCAAVGLADANAQLTSICSKRYENQTLSTPTQPFKFFAGSAFGEQACCSSCLVHDAGTWDPLPPNLSERLRVEQLKGIMPILGCDRRRESHRLSNAQIEEKLARPSLQGQVQVLRLRYLPMISLHGPPLLHAFL